MPGSWQLLVEQIATIGDLQLHSNQVELREQLNSIQEQLDWLLEQVVSLAQGQSCEAQVVNLERTSGAGEERSQKAAGAVEERLQNAPAAFCADTAAVEERRQKAAGAGEERSQKAAGAYGSAPQLLPIEQARIFALIEKGLSNRRILKELGKGGSYHPKVAEARRRYDNDQGISERVI